MTQTAAPRSRKKNGVAANGARAIPPEQFAVLSELLSRDAFARQHGLTYGGDRDIYAVAGYPRELKFANYAALYERDPIAGRIIDMIPETTWRLPPEVSEPEQEDGTEFTRQWAELVDRLGLWRRFGQVDRLSRIGRYAVLMIGVRGEDDRELAQAMPQLSGPDDVLYVSTYAEKYARVESWVIDPRDPRYGLPNTYTIDLASGVSTFRPATQTVVVHHSRVLHIADGLLLDDVFGRPVLQRLYNDMLDLQKVTASTAEAFWQRVAGILTAKIDPEAHVTDEQLEALDDHLKELYHELRKTFYGQGIELGRMGETEPNPKDAADLYMTRIAAGAGIPKRLLFGSETGERASTEDQKTFLGSIAERQQQHAEPVLLRAFVDRLVKQGALPRPGAAGYEVVWPALFEESEATIAEANLKRAQTAAELTPMGGDPTVLVEIDEERNVWLIPRTPDDPSPFDELEPPDEPPEPDTPDDAEEP